MRKVIRSDRTAAQRPAGPKCPAEGLGTVKTDPGVLEALVWRTLASCFPSPTRAQ